MCAVYVGIVGSMGHPAKNNIRRVNLMTIKTGSVERACPVWITLDCPLPRPMLYSCSVSCAGLAWLASHRRLLIPLARGGFFVERASACQCG